MRTVGVRTSDLAVGDRTRPMSGHLDAQWGQVVARDEVRKVVRVRLEAAKGHIWVVREQAE